MGHSPPERPVSKGHVVEETNGEVRLVSMTSAYYVDESNRGDVAVNASFIGVWPARFMAQHRPRALIGVDCGIGKDGAGIAGLWYLEALGIPGVAAAVADVELLNGADVLRSGIVSRRNDLAGDCGVEEGTSIAEAARLLMVNEPRDLDPEERGRRTVVAAHPSGRNIVCTHSIAFPLPEDRNQNVLCTGGFAGAPNIVKASPYGFICSDGGRGRDDSGLDGLKADIPGAVVDVQTARMGDGLSTYHEGVISACNDLATARGVKVGQRAEKAAWLLVSGE
ncbi:MAG TPA: hypothetical protein VGC49_09055 [Solirubrobacterales bacterium]|jgi:hypothetical protein